MEEYSVFIYENLLWDILDQSSKLYIITLLIGKGFQGECKLISKVSDDTTIMEVTDNYNHSLVLPIDILDILNN